MTKSFSFSNKSEKASGERIQRREFYNYVILGNGYVYELSNDDYRKIQSIYEFKGNAEGLRATKRLGRQVATQRINMERGYLYHVDNLGRIVKRKIIIRK